MLSADDLGVFLEVARRGTLTDAARFLEINHTTVSRRIQRLEREVGKRLFDRRPTGWQLTEPGLRLIEHAEAIESAVRAVNEDTVNNASQVEGSVRVIAPDGFGALLLIPGLGPLQERHRNLSIEVVTANRHGSLTTREFDLAVTIERPETRAVIVRKLATFQLRFYASASYLREHESIEALDDLSRHSLIWYVEEALGVETFNMMHGLVPYAHVQIQTNNIAGQIRAAEEGLGVALLPVYLAEPNPRLERATSLDVAVERSYWLSTPKNLSRLARVRAMTAAIEEVIQSTPGLKAAGTAGRGAMVAHRLQPES